MCHHGQQLKSMKSDKARMRTRHIQRVETPGDPGVSGKLLDTGAKDHQLNPDGPRNKHMSKPNKPNI